MTPPGGAIDDDAGPDDESPDDADAGGGPELVGAALDAGGLPPVEVALSDFALCVLCAPSFFLAAVTLVVLQTPFTSELLAITTLGPSVPLPSGTTSPWSAALALLRCENPTPSPSAAASRTTTKTHRIAHPEPRFERVGGGVKRSGGGGVGERVAYRARCCPYFSLISGAASVDRVGDDGASITYVRAVPVAEFQGSDEGYEGDG